MTEKFTYEIGGKTYIQKPLVLGQMRQLMNLMKGIVIPHDIDTLGLVSLLGDKLPRAIAIVLCEEGKSLRDKNLEHLEAEIEFEISPEQTIEVIEDFFDGNLIALLLEKLNEAVGRISEKMAKTGLGSSSAPLPEATSPSETASSGDIP